MRGAPRAKMLLGESGARALAEYYSHFLSEEQLAQHPLLKTALIKVSDFTF